MRAGSRCGPSRDRRGRGGDPGRGRNRRGRRRRHGPRLLRRRDGVQRPPLRLPRDRLRRLARLEPRRLRGGALGEAAISLEVPVGFGEEDRRLLDRPGSCAVPGFPPRSASSGSGSAGFRGSGSSSRRSTSRVPASRSRRCTSARSTMLGDVFSLGRGGELFAPEGPHAAAGDLLVQPGLVHSARGARRGGRARASIAARWPRRSCVSTGVVLTADDLRELLARAGRIPCSSTSTAPRRDARRSLRSARAPAPASPPRGPVRVRPRPRARRRRSRRADDGGEHTTNMVAVDGHGRACVLTHSLGVGAGVWVPGFDLQLNNLLGESDIAFGEPAAGRPSPEPDGAEPRLRRRGPRRSRSAPPGATRLRTALSTVARGRPRRRPRSRGRRSSRPRVHPTPDARRRGARRGRAAPRGARGARTHGPPLGPAPSLLRRRQLRRAERAQRAIRGGAAPRSFCRARQASPYFKQQPVDPPRRDEHPDDAHRQRDTRR